MHTFRLWFGRLVMLYALLIFSFLAYVYVAEPLEHIANFGFSSTDSPETFDFLSAGPGALFLGMALTALTGLARPKLFVICMSVLVLFDGCIVAMRLLGIAVEGITPQQLTELRDEGVSWLFFIAALYWYPRSE